MVEIAVRPSTGLPEIQLKLLSWEKHPGLRISKHHLEATATPRIYANQNTVFSNALKLQAIGKVLRNICAYNDSVTFEGNANMLL